MKFIRHERVQKHSEKQLLFCSAS